MFNFAFCACSYNSISSICLIVIGIFIFVCLCLLVVIESIFDQAPLLISRMLVVFLLCYFPQIPVFVLSHLGILQQIMKNIKGKVIASQAKIVYRDEKLMFSNIPFVHVVR